jgi:uroporphyrinogen-III synthase
MGVEASIYLLSPTPREGVHHLPMIRFETIPQNIDFSRYDGLILTSKQGVKALDEVSGGAWRTLPAAAIGEMTAAEIRARGGKVLYVATKAYGDVLARELGTRFPRFRWLYPRPKVVVSKIAADLSAAGVSVEEKVIYETVCVDYDEAKKPEAGAVLIFTSPSIVKCFLKNFGWEDRWKAVAIGRKTAEAFEKGIEVHTSASPSIDDAISLAHLLAIDKEKRV